MRSIRNLRIVDSTLREGEQFGGARFSSADRVAIAHALDGFAVEYIEMTSPAASPRSAADLRTVAALPLRARILTHIRCRLADARRAVERGARGVNLRFGTSALPRACSHGRGLDEMLPEAVRVIRYPRGEGLEVRFSREDAFRTLLDMRI